MVGITSFDAYVPSYRLSREEISKVWGTKSLGGERAVAKYDEDSLCCDHSSFEDILPAEYRFVHVSRE